MKTFATVFLSLVVTILSAQCVTVQQVSSEDPCLLIGELANNSGTRMPIANRGIAYTTCADITIDSIKIELYNITASFSSVLDIRLGFGDAKPIIHTSTNSVNPIQPGIEYNLTWYFTGATITSGTDITIDLRSIHNFARYYTYPDSNPQLGITDGSTLIGSEDVGIKIYGRSPSS